MTNTNATKLWENKCLEIICSYDAKEQIRLKKLVVNLSKNNDYLLLQNFYTKYSK